MGDKRKQRLNPELHACKENTLSLSYTLGFIFMSLNFREVRAGESSAVQNTCSCRGPGFNPYGGSQSPFTPGPGDLITSLDLCWEQGHIWCPDIHASETFIHMKQINLRKKLP